MTRIYFVEAESGEYEDRESWPGCWFETEQEALNLVKTIEDEVEKASGMRSQPSVYDFDSHEDFIKALNLFLSHHHRILKSYGIGNGDGPRIYLSVSYIDKGPLVKAIR